MPMQLVLSLGLALGLSQVAIFVAVVGLVLREIGFELLTAIRFALAVAHYDWTRTPLDFAAQMLFIGAARSPETRMRLAHAVLIPGLMDKMMELGLLLFPARCACGPILRLLAPDFFERLLRIRPVEIPRLRPELLSRFRIVLYD